MQECYPTTKFVDFRMSKEFSIYCNFTSDEKVSIGVLVIGRKDICHWYDERPHPW
jgi:hypothetical protein